MTINRRELIAGVSATAILVTTTPAAMAEAAKAIHVKPLPAWQVGTPGEMDWHVIFAEDEKTALHEWFAEEHGDYPGNVCDGPCSLEDCECFSPGAEAVRQPKFDNPLNAEPNDIAKFRAGWTVMCDRCDYEAMREDGSHVVGDKVICEGCLTLDDYKICDLEYYAEMAELEATDD